MATLAGMLANRKLHDRINFRGLLISIENRVGSVRRGESNGKAWATKMKYPYGYIRQTEGADGDHVDCFIGPDENADNVYVVHTQNPKNRKYDEDKCMLGFESAEVAKKVFLMHYDDPKYFQSMSIFKFEDFKKEVLRTKHAPGKMAASNGTLAIGDSVVVEGIQYRGVVKKLKGDMVWVEFKGAFNEYLPRIIMRPSHLIEKV